MSTKIPVDDAFAFLQRNLPAEEPRLPLHTDVFQLICVYVVLYLFFYSQIFGLAMGSPLTPVLQTFESELLPSISFCLFIRMWYVDDVFAFWPHDPTLFPDFLTNLTSLSVSR